MIDLVRLKVLVHVVEEGSLTRAAEVLSYSPSAVSQQVRRLEQEIGQPLLHRRARGVAPTEAGEVLVEHARHILRQLAAAEADLADIAGLRRGTLEVGSFPTMGSSFLPGVVRRFRSAHPDVKLRVHSAREGALFELLESGVVSLSLLWDYAWSRVDAPGLVLTPLFQDPTSLMVSVSHPAAGRRTISMEELSGEDWIIRANHPVEEVLRHACAGAGFEPQISFEANDYQEAQAMVSVGLGVALAPRSALLNQHPGIRILSLGTSAPSRRILVAHRRERVRAAAETAFERLLLESARAFEAELQSSPRQPARAPKGRRGDQARATSLPGARSTLSW